MFFTRTVEMATHAVNGHTIDCIVFNVNVFAAWSIQIWKWFIKYGLAQGRCGMIKIINPLVTRSAMLECPWTLLCLLTTAPFSPADGTRPTSPRL